MQLSHQPETDAPVSTNVAQPAAPASEPGKTEPIVLIRSYGGTVQREPHVVTPAQDAELDESPSSRLTLPPDAYAAVLMQAKMRRADFLRNIGKGMRRLLGSFSRRLPSQSRETELKPQRVERY
jgi:hypothetical protein